MVIQAGEYKVLSSGTIISFEDEPISFDLSGDLVIRFVFKEIDGDDKSAKIDFIPVSTNQLDIMLMNFGGAILGTGNVSPLKLGHIDKRNLYLNFRVYAQSESKSKILHYTLYLREINEN